MSNNDCCAAAAPSWYGTGSKDRSCPCTGGCIGDIGDQGKLLFVAVPCSGPVEGWLFHCKPEVLLGVPAHETCDGKVPGLFIVPLANGEGAPHWGHGASVDGREALQYVHNIVTHPLSGWHQGLHLSERNAPPVKVSTRSQ
jgi:hypothetical protein